MGRATMQIVAELPDDLIQEFIQYVRDYDSSHPECHFQMMVKADEKTVEEMEAIFSAIRPPFDFREKIRKQ
jgi:hypothetical protein